MAQKHKLWLVHAAMVVGYFQVLGLVTGDFGGWLASVALVIHGTWVIFQSLQPRLSHLVKVAFALYGAAVLKILIIDLGELGMVEKTMAFMAIGVILLGSAYQFQKVKERTTETLQDG